MILKCKNCGSEEMRVDNREDCHLCPDDDCYQCDDGVCEVDEKDCPYPQEKRHECKNFVSRASENWECEYGGCNNAGCQITTCAECGRIVNFIPMVDA